MTKWCEGQFSPFNFHDYSVLVTEVICEILFSLGAPVYYSSPHFLYGTESLLEGVIGMNPVKEEHMVYFDIQMVSGKIT